MSAKTTRRGHIWSNMAFAQTHEPPRDVNQPRKRAKVVGPKTLRGRLKYFQHRDDRNTAAPQITGQDRWIDRGLGNSWQTIEQNCQHLQSHDRLAWTLVISPAPKVMDMLPDERKRDALMELTETVVESWYVERGLHCPEYAYVIHDAETKSTAEQHLHTHVVLPGTAPTAGGREPFDNKPTQVREFNALVENQWEALLDRELGPVWRERFAEIQRHEAAAKYLLVLDETLEDSSVEGQALATRLYQIGKSVDDIPTSIENPVQLHEWLGKLESMDALEVWFSQPEPLLTNPEPDLDEWFR